MTNCEAAFAEYVEPPKVKTAGPWPGAGVITERDCVLLPMTAILEGPEAKDIGVPDTVICAPGLSV